jgi:hypothetical protein
MVNICTLSGEIMNVNMYGLENPKQCKSCSESGCNGCYDIIRQKLIWRQVRVPSSQLTSVTQAENVVGGPSNAPTIANANVNWNQSSDRANASIQLLYRPTNGNSTKTSITRERPGSQSPGGKGVDVKHNSYDRYLARKKAPILRTESCVSVPVKGNKTKSYGLVTCL